MLHQRLEVFLRRCWLPACASQIPLANGKLATFSASLSTVEKEVLTTLESLGFDRSASVKAVVTIAGQHRGRTLAAGDLQSMAVQMLLDAPAAAAGSASRPIEVVRPIHHTAVTPLAGGNLAAARC